MKGDNNKLPFQRAKVSQNNIKINIKGISGLLEMCKNIVSA